MPLKVVVRSDTGTLWITGTIKPAGSKEGIRIRQRAGSDERSLAEEEAAALEREVLRNHHLGHKPIERDFAAAVDPSRLAHAMRCKGSKRGSRRPNPFTPATMTWAEAADYACRKSESWLRSHINELDFPRPDPVLNIFAKEAVELWVRRRFGIIRPDDSIEQTEAILIDRVHRRQRP